MAGAPARGRVMRVLIVEDDEAVAGLLRQAVTEAGYTALVAADGEAGLDSGRHTDFDLILLDLMLPKIDGLEVCRRLRASGVATPILIITARDAEEDIVSGLDEG